MCKKLIYLCSFVLVLSIASSTSADLVAHWKFDEGSGDTAFDSSGNNYHVILVNNPVWVPGKVGSFALNLDAGGYGGIKGLFYQGSGFPGVSVCAWIRTNSATGQFIASFDRNEYWRLAIGSTNAAVSAGQVGWHLQTDAGVIDYGSVRRVDDGQWHHVCGVYDRGTATIYIDGEPEPSMKQGSTMGRGTLRYGYIGKNSEATVENQAAPDGNPVDGDLDDLRIYDHALTQEEVKLALRGVPPGVASDPKPADETADVPRDVVLSWTPGEFAPPTNGHKVYFSENFNDVNDGIGGIAQDASSYAQPQRLDFAKTYYWRVDEVNGPPDYTVYQGDVWSFTTEPIAYAIENVTATASSSNQADTGPENTVNGSGLGANDLHSKELTDMWLSSAEPLGAWIEFQFDKVYKVHEMWVWNSNQMVELAIGLGFKDVSIEYSLDGTNYTPLGTTTEFSRAPGMSDYAHNTTIDFGGAAAKHVRLTATSNWGGVLPQYGLSEVRFFHIPVRAREPNPDSDATDVDVDVTLSFRAGREAAEHDVYFGSDEQAVIDGNIPVATVTETSYGPLSLDLGQTYYWKINEVNMAETPTTLEGDLWNFTTREFLVVDDFESYNDLDTDNPESNRIFLTWLDGYGIATNGSLVGYENPPFCEQTIVNGGKQSMPLFYANTGGAAYSEAELTLAPTQDWTAAQVQTLAVHFHGTDGNTGQLYVKINGTKVPYDGQASNLAQTGWQAWNIDLASSGASLQNVTKLAIGIDGNGAAGTLYFDDIRLYARSREFITPSAPDDTRLIGHWKFDGDTQDSSGRGNHGTAGVTPEAYVAGEVGSNALDLRGADYVVIDGVVDDITSTDITLSAWVKTTQANEGNVFASNDSASAHPLMFGVTSGNPFVYDGSDITFGPVVNDDQWHLLTYVRDGSQGYVYADGFLRGTYSANFSLETVTRWSIGQEWDSTNPSDFYTGAVDDARIYDYPLSAGEVGWLAGRTEPFDKPF
ncbi:MAG: LamG-like jellyroll fold domain-containing protein [Planctomycetota bacterium]|jgi:hypothetical protein